MQVIVLQTADFLGILHYYNYLEDMQRMVPERENKQ